MIHVSACRTCLVKPLNMADTASLRPGTPSFALRVPDSETGRRVYGEIVAALRMADKLSHSRKG